MNLCTQLALSWSVKYICELHWCPGVASLISFFDHVNEMGISALGAQILALKAVGGCKLSNISPWEATLTTGTRPRKTTVSSLTSREKHH